MTGIITHIQRMSVHDGPGIRSTIFLKGCNLRCAWCHNPETFNPASELEWIESKCISCQACLLLCQTEALHLQEGKVTFDKIKCSNCFDCAYACFPDALQKVGEEITAEELFSRIEPDFQFFKDSEGGITVSGGEPMMQADFTTEILRLFHQAGIHTAIETNLTAPWSKYEQMLPYTDLIMADLKMMDEELHIHWTGASNKSVLLNIQQLDQLDKPYILRTPVVPNVNANDKEMDAIFQFVSGLKNLIKYELLPFHPYAASKYKNMGIPYSFESVASISASEMERYHSMAKKYKLAINSIQYENN